MKVGTIVKVYNAKTGEFVKSSEVTQVLSNGKYKLAYDFFYYSIKTNLSYDGKTRVEVSNDIFAQRRHRLLEKLHNIPDNISDQDLISIARIMNKENSIGEEQNGKLNKK